MRVDGYELTLRAVTSRDLLALGDRSAPDARLALLSRCVVDANLDGATAEVATLPAPVLDAAAQALADADPQADVRLAMVCAGCGHAWKATFDISPISGPNSTPGRAATLHDVHTLARFYGWREADILAMSPSQAEILSRHGRVMSDFLLPDPARQERPAGLVRPRIPSLFETSDAHASMRRSTARLRNPAEIERALSTARGCTGSDDRKRSCSADPARQHATAIRCACGRRTAATVRPLSSQPACGRGWRKRLCKRPSPHPLGVR